MEGVRRSVHFVGVGGIGMSGLAEILLNLGYTVSGSDLRASDITTRLEDYGLRFMASHDAANLGDAGIVVVSAAVAEDNVELVAARQRGIPVLHRSDLLADLMRLKPHAVAVGGTHGKTTTTSMISAFLDRANVGATSIVGGILHRSGTNARWGTGDYLVAEADEHDGSFLRLHPTIAVVTNVDAEHLEHFGTLDRIKRAFIEFCNRVPFYGYSILCWDDPATRDLIPAIENVCLTYGLEEGANLRGGEVTLHAPDPGRPRVAQINALRTRFAVYSYDARLRVTGQLGQLDINAVGLHNVRNALAACAVGLALGMPFALLADGLRQFDGVRRRLQVAGTAGGVTVIEDYAHHPTEIAATLDAVRMAEPGRLLAVLQPHLYSRTQFFCDDFARVLAAADLAYVTDIYPSREAPMPGVHASNIVDAACAQGATHVQLLEDKEAVAEAVAGVGLEPGDVVLVLGAGDINRICPAVLEALERVACR